MGVSLQHARYFKQLRRLQALAHYTASRAWTLNSQVNRDDTWRAIRRAPGFAGGFGVWWTSQGLLPAFPSGLPLICPTEEVVQSMFSAMTSWVRTYEASLAQQRYQLGKQRRLNAMQYVFKDCKLDPAPPVDTLLERLEVGIEEIRPDEASLILAQPVQLLPDLPVVVQGKVLEVIHHEHDQLWVTDVSGIEQGQTVCQERATLSVGEIIQKFHDVWTPRWNKASHVLPDQCVQICGVAERALPKLDWNFQPWTPGRVVSAVSRKKKTSGRGPDGVTQLDLAALPPKAVDSCVAGQNWPLQVASGFVNSLAKHLQACNIDDFRPVTVYSLFYRVWSSERAREALQALTAVLPPGVQGGVPGRQAKSIWYQVDQLLEFSFMNHRPLHGLLMDIRKAFNAIPRFPLWTALQALGFPVDVLRAWCSFVAGQTRRFKVRQAVGPPVQSNCGLPEGCGLSVVGMIVIDWLLDLWLAAYTQGVDLRAFVDDWGLLFGDVSQFPTIWSKVLEFVSALDLSLDMHKTKVWSSDGAARTELREGQVLLAHFARNLGAHQNFTRLEWGFARVFEGRA